jgi:hypothetical protein
MTLPKHEPNPDSIHTGSGALSETSIHTGSGALSETSIHTGSNALDEISATEQDDSLSGK